ncbi:hypothetical protein [Streptomyces griseorubiginosus]|uniref:hypothetical protein n=1 Tax=Streptomyces griseorubiginosus TaxID=67304 RepID=UPI001AD61359|nr:hypothetical protein [Streptomyces griseorubiginosus]MBO4258010.1 hypothetical protein [Streptomyces griseorubiginosus]
MKRRTLPAAAALTAAAALLLTACGGGGDNSKANDKIAGADTGNTKTSAAPSTSAPSKANRPKISFPSYAKNVFEDQKTGDTTKDAVLADSAMSVNSMDDAIFKGSTDAEALGFYNSGKALSSAITFVQGYIDKNDTWIGETRYFDRKVTLSGDGQAYVTYCSDESKSFLKNKRTGKVDKTPTSADSYVLYHTSLSKNPQGVWQTTDIVSNRGDKACQP